MIKSVGQLQAANLTGQTMASSVNSLHTQSAQSGPSNQSGSPPTRSSTDSFPPHFTPDSPRIDREGRVHYPPSHSPERPPSDDGSTFSNESKGSVGSMNSQQSQMSTQSTQGNLETTPRASQPDVGQGLKRSKTFTADRLPLEKEPGRRRDVKEGNFDSPTRSKTVPSPRTPTFPEAEVEQATTLEKIWQPLFDRGNPTMRLSGFLRGLAKHLIDDYEPKNSLVITPAKMLRFLEETKLADEQYPWTTIFGGKMAWSSLSMFYRKLFCQHHLVQTQYHEMPIIPALTPLGFETFMTVLIQAHPDSEYERLAKAVREMPISNADDSKERYPKELSRRLLPMKRNVQAEQRLISSLGHEPNLVSVERGAAAMPPPPASTPPGQSQFGERERNPYYQSNQSSNAFEDEDITTPTGPIERERKPYYAKEGTGKKYNPDGDQVSRDRQSECTDSNQPSREPSRPGANKYRPEMSQRPSRQNTNLPTQATYGKGAPSDASSSTNKPPTGSRSRMPTGPPPHPTYQKGSRRSPPPRAFARSEPNDVGSIPQNQYATNLHTSEKRDRHNGDAEEEATRRNGRRPKYPNEDDSNGRPIPPRNGGYGPSGYDSGYGSAGNPIQQNFAARNGLSDDRRKTWYSGVGTGGSPSQGAGGSGTDGYGSYATPNSTTYGTPGQY